MNKLQGRAPPPQGGFCFLWGARTAVAAEGGCMEAGYVSGGADCVASRL